MLKAYILLTLTMVFFSGNILIGKTIEDLPPATITFFRCLIAFLILFPISLKELTKNQTLWVKEWKPILFLSLTGIVLFNLFLYSGLQYTTATNVAVLETTTPIFSILLGALVLKERLKLVQYLGIFLSIIGALWVITKGTWSSFSFTQFNLGDFLVMIAIIAWAVYSLLIKQHSHKFPLYGSLTIMLFVALVVLFPFVALEWNDGIFNNLNMKLIGGLLYLGIFPSVVALVFWNKGVAAIGPSRASIFLNFIPVFTIFGAVLFLNETVSFIQLLGGVLVIFGVYLSTKEGLIVPRLFPRKKENKSFES
ncbi:DMT family transporter [Bacillus solitudinis]|uniref:DMT family transporter n=1 Tax=Bacillus solitudinis TaxID=2014074 RepID=UPI000C23B3A7|nr:DMT family transporter [Bacillus solitudinis]